jgi:hypothetical protein
MAYAAFPSIRGPRRQIFVDGVEEKLLFSNVDETEYL